MNDSPANGCAVAAPAKFPAALLLLLLPAALTLQLGCPRPSPSPGVVAPSDPKAEHLQQREMFNQAVRSILEYQQYDAPDVLQQAVRRLDQWVQDQEPLPDWQVDSMAAPLFEAFAGFAGTLEGLASQIEELKDQLEFKGLVLQVSALTGALENLAAQLPGPVVQAAPGDVQDPSAQLEAAAGRLRAIARRIEDLADREDFAGAREAAGQLEQLATQLKRAARPADQAAPARLLPQLGDLGRQLAGMDKLRSAQDLEQLVERFRGLAPRFRTFGTEMADFAQQKQVAGRINLAWVGDLAAFVRRFGDVIEQIAQQSDVNQSGLSKFAPQLFQFADRVEQLSTRMRRFTEIGRLEFPDSDRLVLQEMVWIRDVSSWARGDAVDELNQAKQLFDWTVRNVQLDRDAAAEGPDQLRVLQQPWETLLFGRGTATDRAWLFILLARQAGIDAALLEIDDPDETTGQRMPPWVAVLSQGQLYLFEPMLGLPIPAPDGIQRGASGQLDIRPATLAEVADDDALLRQLDVGELRYPVQSSQLERVVALLEASPAYLSQRMKLLESRLTGDERLVVTTDPSAQAERFKACQHVADVRLWELPYQALGQECQLGPERVKWLGPRLVPFSVPFDVTEVARKRPQEVVDGWGWWTIEGRERAAQEAQEAEQAGSPTERTFERALWRARLLHFKGQFQGERSATYYYSRARLPNADLQSPEIDPNFRIVLTQAKMDASYWLGLIAAHQGNTEAAIDWFATRTLESFPNGPRTPGARYNLGRVCEEDGQIARSVETYRSDPDSPARHGNLLRAGWLQPADTPESAAEPTPDDAEQEATPEVKDLPREAEQLPQQAEPSSPEGMKEPAAEIAPEPTVQGAEEPVTESTEEPAADPGEEPRGDTRESPQSSSDEP